MTEQTQTLTLSTFGPGTVKVPESVASRYVVKKQITREILPQVDGIPFCIEFEGEARELPPVENPKYDTPMKAADVINLETGELALLCMNKVLASELDKAFPNGGYVGRKFAILRGKARDTDKRYRVYRILELTEVDGVHKSAGNGVIDGTSAEAIVDAKKKKHN